MTLHASHVASPFPEQALPPWRRAVLKVGSSLLAADGEQLLLSRNFADGKAAGAVTKQLQSGQALDVRIEGLRFSVWLDGAAVADSAEFADPASLDAAIQALRIALTPLED